MAQANLFAYLAAFVTIVLAIALTDMVQSTHRLLRAWALVKWDILTPLMALWVFLWILAEFFGLWADARFDKITFFGLLGLMAVPVVTALTAYAVLPDDVPPEGLDLERFYFDNQRYLILLLVLLHLGDVARIVVYAIRFDGFQKWEPWVPWLELWSIAFATLALLYFVRVRRAQLVGIIGLFGVAIWGFSGWEIQAAP